MSLEIAAGGEGDVEFRHGMRWEQIEGLPLYFLAVGKDKYEEYVGYARWLYGGDASSARDRATRGRPAAASRGTARPPAGRRGRGSCRTRAT